MTEIDLTDDAPRALRPWDEPAEATRRIISLLSMHEELIDLPAEETPPEGSLDLRVTSY